MLQNPGLPILNALPLNRRQMLKTANAGFGYLALASLLGQTAPRIASGNEKPAGPLAPKPPQLPVKAKRIIFLFMEGGSRPLEATANPIRARESQRCTQGC